MLARSASVNAEPASATARIAARMVRACAGVTSMCIDISDQSLVSRNLSHLPSLYSEAASFRQLLRWSSFFVRWIARGLPRTARHKEYAPVCSLSEEMLGTTIDKYTSQCYNF